MNPLQFTERFVSDSRASYGAFTRSLQLRVPIAGRSPVRSANRLAYGIVAALTVAGIAFSFVPLGGRDLAVPVAVLVGAIFSIGATIALLRASAFGETQAGLALAVGLGAGAVTSLLTLFAATLGPAHVALSPTRGLNAGVCSYVVWYATELIGVGAYVVQRCAFPPAVKRLAIVLEMLIVAALISVLEWAIAFAPALLPQVVHGESLHELNTAGCGIVLVAAIVVSIVAQARLSHRTDIDEAIVKMQIALGLGIAIAQFGVDFTSPSVLCARLLQICGVTFVLIAVVKWKIDEEHRSLVAVLAVESQSRAERIQAIWEMAAVEESDQRRRFERMLEISCPSIRPGKPIRATLSHLEGDDVVYDAVNWPNELADEQAMFSGSVVPFARSVQALVSVDGKSRAWNDIEQSEIAGMTRASDVGVSSMIASTVLIGRSHYYLVYSCVQTMTDAPFTDDDLSYVDIVASIFSTTFKQFEYVDRLRHQMEHDALTGLENRTQFRKAVRAEIAVEQPFAVAVVNLDRFRTINERYGQMLGDEVLVEIAYELRAVNIGNMVARLNGDEFGILMRGTRDPSNVAAESQRYLERFQRPFHTGDRDGTRMLGVGASLGCAISPDHGGTVEDLMRSADVALEVAKNGGGGAIAVFDESMEHIVEQRLVAMTDLMRALANDEFRLVYQPTFELRSRQITGAEALLRWDHPEHGEIMPADFIPMAERANVIGALSLWVLARLTRDLAAAQLPEHFRCYFNLAASDLSDFIFIRRLTDKLAEHPWLADSLGVEITETTAMQNVDRSLNTIGIIRSLGVRVAIDDFGTGYSSLSYLKRLSVDLIKIDRAFVTDLPGDERDGALTGAMIGICDRFKAASLAEGIETEEQLEWLSAHGCRYGQGYLISKPISFAQLQTRLDAQQPIAS